MKRVVVLHGMKRSGIHGVVGWLRAQERFVFLNNAIPILPVLRGEKEIPQPQDFESWLGRELPPRRIPFPAPLKRLLFGRSALLVGLEDHDPCVRLFRADPANLTNLLVLRDPANLLASRIRKASSMDHPAYPRERGALMDRVVANWKKHAREFLGTTAHLANRVNVYFPRWFADPAYRAEVSARLGLTFDDSGFSAVAGEGGGSSFDGTLFDGRASEMNVLDRRSQLSPGERGLLGQVLEDPELLELARAVERESAA
jgi:hypothetical protein